jgi:hypothetical protein
LVFLLIGSFSWGQDIGSKPAQKSAFPAPSTPDAPASDQGQHSKANAAPDTPVITIDGLCDNPLADKALASSCKTVITQAQFERVIDAVQPNMPARARRDFALRYADALVMTKKAEEMGLNKGPNYEEQLEVARIQILSKQLGKVIQDKASQISDKDIQNYYYKNTESFEKAEIDRILVPKTLQPPVDSDKTLSDADRQARSKVSEQTMKSEAENLYARAVAGEEFTKLQADAYQVAGIKRAAPNTSLSIRRTSLPPNQASIMDLKPGEVSSVLDDPNGYVIYKVKTKSTLPLDQAREEIKGTLRALRVQDEMRSIQDSVTPALDESYFRPSRKPQGATSTGEQESPSSQPEFSQTDE